MFEVLVDVVGCGEVIVFLCLYIVKYFEMYDVFGVEICWLKLLFGYGGLVVEDLMGWVE